ncbi:hypothetical protein BY458DRAFT_503655 [Sporodiniella umbellata]|nr:hypothetical protein BY458DRAFT_503655 [Sporodiniella umbellata]
MDKKDEFPIKNQQVAVNIEGVPTEILIQGFSDKIFVVVTQYGKIGSLIHTSLDAAPHRISTLDTFPTTSQVLMGDSNSSQSDMYILYSTSILQAIVAMNPQETRPLLLGIALKFSEDLKKNRQVFHEITDLILSRPVW